MSSSSPNSIAIPIDDATPTTPKISDIAERKTNKPLIPRIFSSKKKGIDISEGNENVPNELDKNMSSRKKAVMESSGFIKRGFSEKLSSQEMETLKLSSSCDQGIVKDVRVFVGTWNVGGTAPTHGLNLEEFLQVDGSVDIYALGFQEIVPLSAGNVLVMEDNEPATKWLALIHHTLNKRPYTNDTFHSGLLPTKNTIFNKASLKTLSKLLRSNDELLKACNCNGDITSAEVGARSLKLRGSPIENEIGSLSMSGNYQMVASKQMVGLFLTVWGRKEVVKAIGHVRVSSMGRGIMGYLGNKGCISISMTVHRTSFCFVCSHLASGEKEGDEVRRNSDVSEILKGIYFPNVCNNPNRKSPVMIRDHERMIWMGDLNYRLGLSYEEAIRLVSKNQDWDSLLDKDQVWIDDSPENLQECECVLTSNKNKHVRIDSVVTRSVVYRFNNFFYLRAIGMDDIQEFTEILLDYEYEKNGYHPLRHHLMEDFLTVRIGWNLWPRMQ